MKKVKVTIWEENGERIRVFRDVDSGNPLKYLYQESEFHEDKEISEKEARAAYDKARMIKVDEFIIPSF